MNRIILLALLAPGAVGCSTTANTHTAAPPTTVQTEYRSAKPAEPGVVPAGYRSPFDSGKDCKT